MSRFMNTIQKWIVFFFIKENLDIENGIIYNTIDESSFRYECNLKWFEKQKRCILPGIKDAISG